LSAVLLALAASLTWGFADFGAGLGARRVRVPLVIVASQVAGLVFVGLLVAVLRPHAPSTGQLGWAALGGAIGLFGLASFYRGLAIGAMGIVGPLAATAAVVPLAYGLARGERPSSLQLAGVALAFVGVLAASLERLQHDEGRRMSAGVGFALFAALAFGLALTCMSKAAPGGALWATLAMRATTVPMILFAVLVLRPPTQGLRASFWLIVAAGIGDTGATIMFGAATTRGLLSVVSVLASLYPVVLVAMARFVLHERIARHQFAGVAVALTGVALISAG
jgi:drug/metabolite transporter (DMT)-like permease